MSKASMGDVSRGLDLRQGSILVLSILNMDGGFRRNLNRNRAYPGHGYPISIFCFPQGGWADPDSATLLNLKCVGSTRRMRSECLDTVS